MSQLRCIATRGPPDGAPVILCFDHDLLWYSLQCENFVAVVVGYCNAVLAGAPKVTTDNLQCVLNAAARVVSGTHKFDRGLSRLLHTELHCVPKKVTPNSNHYNYGTPYQN